MKPKKRTTKRSKRNAAGHKHGMSSTDLKLRYKFFILMGTLFLAGTAMVLRLESPVIWTFLYGIGGWAAFTIPHTKGY